MKIGYFTTAFPFKNPRTGEMTKPYVGGGVGEVVYNLTINMAQRGHEVFVFTSSHLDFINSIEDYGNIKIYRYKRNLTIGDKLAFSVSSLYRPLLTNINLDIVHIHVGNLPLPLTGYFYAKIKNKPLITTYHEDYLGGFGSLVRRFGVYLFDSFIADKLISESNIILTPSKYYINKSKHLCKVENMVKAIPNGINLEELKISFSKEECREKLSVPLDKKIILFVGSLTPRKAPDVLLKAMSNVIQNVPNAYLVFVGDGMMREELEQLAHNLNINKNVRFTGFISNDLKLLYYKASDLFVLPSFSEGFGIVLLEACAFGLPLVVSNLDVFRTIVKNKFNGLFVEIDDESDLGDKITFLLQNDDIRLKMGENGRQYVMNFSWERVATETEKVYYDVQKI